MAQQSTTVDLATSSVTIITDELTLAKLGGLIASNDGRRHELTIRLTAGRNGWQNIRVSSRTDFGSPMEFGRLVQDGKVVRWSYGRKAPSLVIKAVQAIRAAQREAGIALPTEQELRSPSPRTITAQRFAEAAQPSSDPIQARRDREIAQAKALGYETVGDFGFYVGNQFIEVE